MNSAYLFLLSCAVFSGALCFFAAGVLVVFRERPAAAARVWIALAGIVLLGGWLRFSQAPPGFKTFYDEYENYNAARTLAQNHDFSFCEYGTVSRCEKKTLPIHPVGFPFLGAVAFRATGREAPPTLFGLNALIGTLCAPVMFLIGMAAGAGAASALGMALLAAILPLHVITSTGAGPEAANFLMLGIAIFFLILMLRSPSAAAAPGLLCALVGAILLRPENVLFPAVALAAAAACRPFSRKVFLRMGWVFLGALALLAPLSPMYHNIFVVNRLYISSSYMPGAVSALRGNLAFFFTSPVLLWFYPALALGGLALQIKGRPGGHWPVFFFVVYTGGLSVLNIQFTQGDFSRHALPVTICLIYWAGILLGRIYGTKPLPGVRPALFALLAVLAFVGYNRSFLPLTDYLEAQDAFFAKSLPRIPGECSLYLPGVAAGMAYTANRTYPADRLLDPAFMRTHRECKYFIQDVFCATSFYDTCRAVIEKYDLEEQQSRDMLGYYKASVSRVRGRAGASSRDGRKSMSGGAPPEETGP